MGLTLLFDIDGTLLRTGGAGFAAMKKAARELFQHSNFQQVPFHGRTDTGIVQELFEVNGIEDSSDHRKSFIELYLELLPNTLAETDGNLLPGVTELLEKIARNQYIRTGLLTGNVEAAAWLKLEHYGIRQFFNFGGFGDTHADRNLVAGQALEAAIEMGHQPSDSLFVIGDTPNDVRCGRAIDARVIAVQTGGINKVKLEAAEADYLFQDLSDHRQFFDAVEIG